MRVHDEALHMTYNKEHTALKFELFKRRENRCLTFGLRCLKPSKHKSLFPSNRTSEQNTRNPNKFKVNFARTSAYKDSAVPYIQNMLNEHFSKKSPI